MLSVNPFNKVAGGGDFQSVEIRVSALALPPGVFYRTLVIAPGSTPPAPPGLSRPSAMDLAPLAVPVTVRVVAPQIKLVPTSFVVSQLPSSTSSSKLQISNPGTSLLVWHLGGELLPWMGVKHTAGNGSVLCHAGSAATLATMGICDSIVTTAESFIGDLSAGLNTELDVITVSRDLTLGGVFLGDITLNSNVPDFPSISITISMEATLLGVIPRESTLHLRPGGSGTTFFRMDTLTPDADLMTSLQLHEVPSWLQVMSALELQSMVIPSNAGALFVAVRVAHGGEECGIDESERAGTLLCLPQGQRSAETVLRFHVQALPLDNSTQLRRDLGRFSASISIPIHVRLMESALTPSASGMQVPSQLSSTAGDSQETGVTH